MKSDPKTQKSVVEFDRSSFKSSIETPFISANNAPNESYNKLTNLPVINAEQLEAIANETRALFLEEEAPEYLAKLEQEIEKLKANDEASARQECAVLIRIAHSLKGGASLAQLPILSQLAHKLEDLLLALQQGLLNNRAMVCDLLERSLEQMRDRLDRSNFNVAIAEPDILPIIAEIENFLQAQNGEMEKGRREKGEGKREKGEELPITNYPLPKSDFVKTALLVDLEECLQRLELMLLRQKPGAREKEISESSDLTFHNELQEAIATWVEECTLLGQALALTWLIDTAELIRQASSRRVPAIEQIAITAIAHVREMRSQYLGETVENKEKDKNLTNFPIFNPHAPITNPPLSQENQEAPKIPDRFLKYILVNSEIKSETPALNLRVPVERLDRMGNVVGELSIDCERLALYREQLSQASRNLKKCTFPAIAAIREPNNLYIRELMVQVQESRSDVDLIARELQETLDRMRSSLDLLHEDLRASRLVPFGLLSDRFLALLQSLKQKYNKSVDLIVEGKDTPIDRVVLEQLQMPLTHLFNNAFDHGIELPEERRACQKPPNAKIVLSASTSGNNISIAIADDGRGINPQKVYQRAVEMGLIDRESNFSSETSLSNQGEILEFLFAPGFSTKTTVSEISGRGVGLDIVRHQIARLRGSLQVETTPKQGTKFTISIPLTLNILSLLLCRCGQRTLAIPSIDVQEIISLSEFSLPGNGFIDWNERSVPLFSLMSLLPYDRPEMLPNSSVLIPNLGIVLKVNEEPVVVAVDAVLGERELVLKPFDSTVSVPDYVAGCTVLGTGEVVPVLSPNQFGELIHRVKKKEARSQKGENSLNSQFSGFKASARSILIVDDSIALRRSLERLLSQAGYQVVQCRDGKEALEELLQSGGGFDLVISDVEMPRLDGLALLKAIRAHASTWHLPVAMLTSRESDPLRQQAMSLGATAYFIKPFAPLQLLSAIAQLLEG